MIYTLNCTVGRIFHTDGFFCKNLNEFHIHIFQFNLINRWMMEQPQTDVIRMLWPLYGMSMAFRNIISKVPKKLYLILLFSFVILCALMASQKGTSLKRSLISWKVEPQRLRKYNYKNNKTIGVGLFNFSLSNFYKNAAKEDWHQCIEDIQSEIIQ